MRGTPPQYNAAGTPSPPRSVRSRLPRFMAQELDSTIRDNAQGPESAETDGVRVRQHNLRDQIEADKYLAGKDAVGKNPAKAFTRVKIVPPGTV